ncbi:MAG: PIN domain-containing protein, partial [Candidatus Hydrogenedentes bacterium]|nr:PIN domain-containing protein [Candidatus Hydrogenedentota bacterium]
WESLVTVVKRQKLEFGNPKIVDTSVIIDGRIQDIVESGFIEGTLVVPRFILRELQHVADSADVLRRTKGRRGLDILKAMQENPGKVEVEIIDDDPEEIREVDGKLVALARKYKAKILTTDYNLNKVAQIEGIGVLNVNDLANALKPTALPDENLEVKIVKEGKEADQGVGYLDDGTMIVVDGGRNYVGRRVSVVVTSVLQTAAGRMIFTKLGQVLPEETRQAL